MRTHAKVKLCQFFKQNTAVHVFYGEGFISTNTNWFIYFVFVVKLPWCRARAPVAALCTPFGIRLPQKNMLVCDIRILCALLALSFKCFYLLQNVLNWMVSLKLISIVFREEGGGSHLFRISQAHRHFYGLFWLYVFLCVSFETQLKIVLFWTI